MKEMEITFTRDERDFIYTQLGGRKDYFQRDLVECANKNDFAGVKRCTKAIEKIEAIQYKLLNG